MSSARKGYKLMRQMKINEQTIKNKDVRGNNNVRDFRSLHRKASKNQYLHVIDINYSKTAYPALFESSVINRAPLCHTVAWYRGIH